MIPQVLTLHSRTPVNRRPQPPSRTNAHEPGLTHDQALQTALFSTPTDATSHHAGSRTSYVHENTSMKMGTLPKECPLTEDALKEYIATFEAPIPQDTITALAQVFRTDCHLTSLADDALI